MSNTKYIVDANASISNYYATESVIYTDPEGVERVAYSVDDRTRGDGCASEAKYLREMNTDGITQHSTRYMG